MAVDRPEEQFAFESVRRVLGVRVEEYDVGGVQNAVDALLHYPDGRTAALEVSSVGPAEEARISNVLGRPEQYRRTVAGLEMSWIVSIPRTFHPRDLSRIDAALLLCQQLGLTQLARVDNDDLDSLISMGVWAQATEPASVKPPVVWVVLNMIGGFSDGGALALTAELPAVLATDTMRSKLTKLAASGHDERHLFLLVRPAAFSFPAYALLAFGGDLPTGPVALPDGLSHLWLLSGWQKGGLIHATRDGWTHHSPFDDPNG